jgi:lysozyme
MTSKGFELLVELEGIRLSAYLDPGGTPTIGVGSTYYADGRKVSMGDTITREEAIELCKKLVSTVYEQWVHQNLKVLLNPFQLDALTILCYNIGQGNLGNSTVWKLINEGKSTRVEIENAWRLWRKSRGVVLQGLVNRRNKELAHYYSDFQPYYEPTPGMLKNFTTIELIEELRRRHI